MRRCGGVSRMATCAVEGCSIVHNRSCIRIILLNTGASLPKIVKADEGKTRRQHATALDASHRAQCWSYRPSRSAQSREKSAQDSHQESKHQSQSQQKWSDAECEGQMRERLPVHRARG